MITGLYHSNSWGYLLITLRIWIFINVLPITRIATYSSSIPETGFRTWLCFPGIVYRAIRWPYTDLALGAYAAQNGVYPQKWNRRCSTNVAQSTHVSESGRPVPGRHATSALSPFAGTARTHGRLWLWKPPLPPTKCPTLSRTDGTHTTMNLSVSEC
jgi:hypothetical protein